MLCLQYIMDIINTVYNNRTTVERRALAHKGYFITDSGKQCHWSSQSIWYPGEKIPGGWIHGGRRDVTGAAACTLRINSGPGSWAYSNNIGNFIKHSVASYHLLSNWSELYCSYVEHKSYVRPYPYDNHVTPSLSINNTVLYILIIMLLINTMIIWVYTRI